MAPQTFKSRINGIDKHEAMIKKKNPKKIKILKA
jgi:hypothetical protein